MERFFLISIWFRVARAASCGSQALALPITDIQVLPDIQDSLMRGISATIGDPEQDIVLLPWPELNNTWIYDQRDYCDPAAIWSDLICQVRRGNYYYESNSTSFVPSSGDIVAAGGASQETDVSGAESGIRNLIGSSLAGNDRVNVESSGDNENFPIGIPRAAWDSGYTTLHALGLGKDSTFLNAMLKARRISGRVWSIFWGRMWTTDNPLDGSLMIGGYDRSKVLGQNYTKSLDYGSAGCWTGMKITVVDIKLISKTGNSASIVLPHMQFSVCIVPQRQLLMEMPDYIYEFFEQATATSHTGLSFGLHRGAHLYETGTQFEGDITISLDTGLSVRIPNDQYVVPWVDFDRNGSRIFNDSRREVLISEIGQDRPATLGRYFFTEAYLMVDHDAGQFTMWQANPTQESDLVAFSSTNCDDDSSSAAPTETPRPDKHLSGGAIAGAVIGTLAGCAIVGLVVFLYWRKRFSKSQKASKASVLSTQSVEFKPELDGTSSHHPSGVPSGVPSGALSSSYVPEFALERSQDNVTRNSNNPSEMP